MAISSSSSSRLKDPPQSALTTTATTSLSTTTLHPWARIRKRTAAEASELAQQTSTKTSEYRLRMESVQWWRQYVEEAQGSAWKRLVQPTIMECHAFLEYQECHENENAQDNTEEIDNEQPWWQQFCLPSTSVSKHARIRYPAEVLPIMVVSSPLTSSCFMDRHAIASTIWKEWNDNSLQPEANDLCLFLPRLLPTLTDTLYLLADGIATILKQSPIYSKYSFLLMSRKKRKRTLQSSIQDWIFEVLQTLPAKTKGMETGGSPQDNQSHTPPPNLVIVLQDDVASSHVVKQQFLQMLTSWRSLSGIPVSLVVLESSSSGPDGSLSSLLRKGEDGMNGRSGCRVSYVSLPTTEDFSNAMALWAQYFLEALTAVPPPVVLRNSDDGSVLGLTEWTQQSIIESASCSRMVNRLSTMITEFFSLPGSFVWDSLRTPSTDVVASTANVLQPNFCAWFCVYEKAQIMLSQSDGDKSTKLTAAEKCSALLECRRLLQAGGQVHFWWAVACALLPLQIWVLTRKEMPPVQTEKDNMMPQSLSNTFMLSQLGRAYQLVANGASTADDTATEDQDEVSQILSHYLKQDDDDMENTNDDTKENTNDVDTDAETMNKLKKMIGELVLIMNNFQGESNTETTMAAKDITKGILQMLLHLNHLVAERMDDWTRQWMYVNPLMKWMNLEGPYAQKKQYTAPRPMTTLNIRRDVVAGLDPSTQRLLSVLQDQMTITKDDWFRAFGGSMHEFCVGLWTLQMVGLVQPKKGNGANKVIYEKVSVVWC